MIASLNSALAWAQQGQRVPASSFEIYAQVGSLIKDTVADFAKDSGDAAAARQASLTLKAAAEQKLAAAAKVPATADAAQAAARQIVMCGAFAGALDTALNLALKEAPGTKTPDLPASPDIHQGMQQLYAQLATTVDQSETAARTSPGNLDQAMNQVRSELDELTRDTANDVGNAGGAKDYQQMLGMIFYGAYGVGTSQAALGLIAGRND